MNVTPERVGPYGGDGGFISILFTLVGAHILFAMFPRTMKWLTMIGWALIIWFFAYMFLADHREVVPCDSYVGGQTLLVRVEEDGMCVKTERPRDLWGIQRDQSVPGWQMRP